MTTHADNIDSTAARALLMADYRITNVSITRSGLVKVTLRNGDLWRRNEKRTDYFRTAIIAAHALDTIISETDLIQEIYNQDEEFCYWEDARRNDRRAARGAWEISCNG